MSDERKKLARLGGKWPISAFFGEEFMLPVLDNDHLRTLVAIAETGSFTRAADIVHKTQSAVSMQIRKLEERLGREIFGKEGRAAKLTPDGEKLLDYAYRMLRLNDEVISAFRGEKLTGSVKLGVPDDYAERYLPEIMARFTASNPGIEVAVVCEPTPALVENMQACEIDLAIITHSKQRDIGEIIREEKLLWVSSQRHCVHEARPLPLALGRDTCNWRRSAVARLEARVAWEEILKIAEDFEVEKDRTERMHSPQVRGFTHLPIRFTPRTSAR
jgi:DNA-binding transcriptional LysR family regulator